MKKSEVALFLRQYNLWRRGSDLYKQPDPKELSVVIDLAVEYLSNEKTLCNSSVDTAVDKGDKRCDDTAERPTRFTDLMQSCGLSNKGAAHLLGVRYDTIKNWRYGKAQVPEGVLRDLQRYAEAAEEIFNRIEAGSG